MARRQTDSKSRFEQSPVVCHEHSAIAPNGCGNVQRVKGPQRHVEREYLKMWRQLIDRERCGGFDAAMHRREHAHDFRVRQHAFAPQTMRR